MKNLLVFISTRNIFNLNFKLMKKIDSKIILFASDHEISCLSDNIKRYFLKIITTPVINNDGIIFEYDENFVKTYVSHFSINCNNISIVCFDEGNIELAEQLRLDISNISKEYISLNTNLFRDKILMKKKLAENNIRVPIFYCYREGIIGYSKMKELVGNNFIIKPRKSAGSNNVFSIKTNEEYEKTIKNIDRDIMAYEAEEYIDGELYHCDIAIHDKKIVFSECTKYYAPTLDFQKGKPLGGFILDCDSKVRNELIEFTKNCLFTLGANNGVYHTEIFKEKSTGKLVFLESGARPPGMLVIKMYEKATSINLLNLDIDIQRNCKKYQELRMLYKRRNSFYLVYPKGVGVIESFNNIPNSVNVELDYNLACNIGDYNNGCYSNLDYCASVVCVGDSLAVNKSYEIFAKFKPVNYS